MIVYEVLLGSVPGRIGTSYSYQLLLMNPKFGDLKTHSSSGFGLFGSRNGNFEFGSPWSQIADISDPSGSMIDLL